MDIIKTDNSLEFSSNLLLITKESFIFEIEKIRISVIKKFCKFYFKSREGFAK